MEKRPLPIQIFRHALIFFAVSFSSTLRFQLSKKTKNGPQRKAKKNTKWGRKAPPAPEPVPVSSVQCSRHRLPFWSGIEPRCYYSTGCCLHLSNSSCFETPCFSSVTSRLLFRELHAVIFFHAFSSFFSCISSYIHYYQGKFKEK